MRIALCQINTALLLVATGSAAMRKAILPGTTLVLAAMLAVGWLM